MDATSRGILWRQLGAAIDMLENAIRMCPDDLWDDRGRQPEFWHVAFHTLFYLDFYLEDAAEGFSPPPPFTLSELEPSGILPDRVYRKNELLAYLTHGRNKTRARIAGLTAKNKDECCRYGWIDLTRTESLLYTMRHVQHHAAQLNLLIRQATNTAPRWVSTTSSDL